MLLFRSFFNLILHLPLRVIAPDFIESQLYSNFISRKTRFNLLARNF